MTVCYEYVFEDGNTMPKLFIRFLLTSIVSAGLVISATASADTIKRSSSRLDRVEEPRIYSKRSIKSSSRNNNRSNSSQSTTSRQSNILYRRAPVRKPTTNKKPTQSTYQKPASTYQKPQRTYKPLTTTKPRVNNYRPPVNNYRPPVNNYRPPINAYKPPTNSSVQRGNSSFRPVFPKRSISTGLRRSDDRNRQNSASAFNNNRNQVRPYRPWSSIFNNRYQPNRHPHWFSNAGHRFPIEQSFSIWANSYNQAYRPGYSTNYLPSYYNRFSWNNRAYYSYGGLFFNYNRGNRNFSLVSAPIGYRLNSLPQHSIGFYRGNDLFFNAYNNYYRWLPTAREYIVVQRPDYDDYDQDLAEYIDESYVEPEESYHVSYHDGAPIYYPAAGQNEAQMSLDLDECHIWAAKETNFDPAIPYPSHDEYKADGFGLALEACMISRSYTVL